ncbi:MAG: hypothetical protein QXQ02_08090 [Halobacteria archaeon]
MTPESFRKLLDEIDKLVNIVTRLKEEKKELQEKLSDTENRLFEAERIIAELKGENEQLRRSIETEISSYREERELLSAKLAEVFEKLKTLEE